MSSDRPKRIYIRSEEECEHAPSFACSRCRVAPVCLPDHLSDLEIQQLESVVQRSKLLEKNELIYRQNDPFESIFAVRVGFVKTYKVDSRGNEQVLGFHLPGELFGVAAIGKDSYPTTAAALETASICAIPYDRLQELSVQIPQLHYRFVRLMSGEINMELELTALLNKNSAAARVSAFLISLGQRYARRNQSSMRFRLPMARSDIGNYLGLTVETVSRVIHRLSEDGVVAVDNREVEILDNNSLHNCAEEN